MNPTPLLAPLQALLDRNVAESPEARSLARRLDGRSMKLDIAGTPFKLRLAAADGRVSVLADDDAADATISGSPLALASLAAPAAENRIRGGAVEIRGDAEIAQGFQQLLRAARPDLEAELARVIGDVAAFRLGQLARAVLGHGERIATTMRANISEYLVEESGDVPHRDEVQAFIDGVDHLRDGVDRAEARLKLLERRRGSAA